MRNILVAACLLAIGPALAGEAPPPPQFAAKPTASKTADGKVKIEFTVDRETDVTVWIEDAGGRPVRRLVSGVLGKNPPAPLKPGLAQSVEWDGKADWGRPAPAGPFRVRVALGLGAKYDKEIVADRNHLGNVSSIAAGPDGTLYALVRGGPAVPHWPATRLVALNRDGTFQRTLVPQPSTATKEQIQAMGGTPVEVGGRTVPMVLNVNEHRTTALWGHENDTLDLTAAMTPGGQLLAMCSDSKGHLGVVDTTGSQAPASFLGPSVLPKFPAATTAEARWAAINRIYLASSGDGRYAYFSGLKGKRADVSYWSAVYRVKLPERTPAEPFFGDPEKAGSDETHLGSYAHGMAADGKGNLLVCDPANKRVVVVSEADGKFVSSFPAENPELVAVDKETGAIYLLGLVGAPGRDPRPIHAGVVKLAGWKDPRPLASTRVNILRDYLWWRFAVDTSAKPAVLWLSNDWQLYRFEEQDGKFTDVRRINFARSAPDNVEKAEALAPVGDGAFVGLTVDHWREDPEVYLRSGSGMLLRYDEKADKIDIGAGFLPGGAQGSVAEPGPDGNLYAPAWTRYLYKFDRNGKPLKWGVPYVHPNGEKPPPSDNAIFIPVVMVYTTHTVGLRGDGNIFVFEEAGVGDHRKNECKALYEYAPSGKRLGGPIVWKGSDSVIGPKFDQEGNIYVAEQVRPADQLMPPEFLGVTGPVTMKSGGWPAGDPRLAAAMMYGSIVKFGPKGGSLGCAYPDPLGEAKLDPAMKTVDAASWITGRGGYSSNKVTGALWMHMGVSQVALRNCNCENPRFDVDPYGRVWYPDAGRYRVGVLDTNGNEITTFGSYGNAESRGPDSPVVDPKTGKVRPRSADDPKDLKSPFAEPDIAFAWLVGVGATDKYAYMGDTLNRRLLRAKLVYAAEETCEVK